MVVSRRNCSLREPAGPVALRLRSLALRKRRSKLALGTRLRIVEFLLSTMPYFMTAVIIRSTANPAPNNPAPVHTGGSGNIGEINPATGKMVEHKLPIRSTPYETWPDKKNNIWASDDFNNSLIYFNPHTNHFTYYPLPQDWDEPGVPKVEIDKDNTVWIGSRRTAHAVAVHFYPDGYTAEAPPKP